MSLILDALSRSQRERDGDALVPGIDTQHYHTPATDGRKWRDAFPWVALGLAVMVITFLLVRQEGASQSVEQISSSAITHHEPTAAAEASIAADETGVSAVTADEPQAAEQEPVLSATPTSNQRSSSHLQSPPASVTTAAAGPDNEAVAALYETPSSVRKEVAEITGIQTAKQATPAKDRSLASAPVSDAEQARETAEPVEIEALLARAQQEVAQNRLSEHSAPFLEQLSQQKKDQVPTLMYSRHDYSSQASQSRVLINGKTAKVGDTVASGVKLEEILPDSSVFSYRGEPFRLVALNSWVNL